MFDKRLEAIEEELKLLRGIMQSMARADERLTFLIETTTRLASDDDKLEHRVRMLESSGATQKQSISAIERFFWLAIAVATAYVGSHFK